MTVPGAARWRGQGHRHLTEAVGYADIALDGVTGQLLSCPTPCRAWDLRMLLEHAGDSLAVLIEGLTVRRIREPPTLGLSAEPPPADIRSASDLVGAIRRRSAELLDASAQAGAGRPVAAGVHQLPVDCVRTVGVLEIAVHAWDVSQACGQHLPVPEDLAGSLLVQAVLLVPRLGREPLFGAPVPAPARSTAGERLLAYLGRPAPRSRVG